MSSTAFVDYYQVLGLANTASTAEINKAYRTLARKVHPDRNPDDPNANEKFQKLSKAYEILSDDKAKAAFDAVIRTKMRAKERDSKLSDKRRQMKETLEEREKASNDLRREEELAERRLQAEIERIRRDAKKRKQELSEQMEEEEKRREDTLKRMKTAATPSQPPAPARPSYEDTQEYHDNLERETLALLAQAARFMKDRAAMNTN